MRLINQVKILKEHGFKFKRISGRSRAVYAFNSVFITIYKYYTKKDLLDKIREAKNTSARSFRSSFKLIQGGYSWVPTGIKTQQGEQKKPVLSLLKAF